MELTEFGREVKKNGGHIKYSKLLERQRKKANRLKYYPIMVAVFANLVSVIMFLFERIKNNRQAITNLEHYQLLTNKVDSLEAIIQDLQVANDSIL